MVGGPRYGRIGYAVWVVARGCVDEESGILWRWVNQERPRSGVRCRRWRENFFDCWVVYFLVLGGGEIFSTAGSGISGVEWRKFFRLLGRVFSSVRWWGFCFG